MTQLLAIRGPAARRYIEVETADVAAATDEDEGWAMVPTPGATILYDDNAPYSGDWEIPGYVIPPELYPPTPEEPEAAQQ